MWKYGFILSKKIFLGFFTCTSLSLDGHPIFMAVNVATAPSSNYSVHDPMTLVLIIIFHSCYLFYRLYPARAKSEKKSKRDCNFRQGLSKLWPKTCPPSGFEHKVLLNSSAHSSAYCPWLPLHYSGGAEELKQRPLGLKSLTCLLSGPLKFDDPCFRFLCN